MDIYALELIRHLQLIDQINQYFIFVRPGEDHCLQDTNNFKIIEIKALTYADWEQVHLPMVASNLKLDLLHCTSNTAPIFSPVPLMVTLHDIIYLNQSYGGGSWYQRLGHYYRKWIVPIVFKNAQKVFTVSHFEKGQIDQHFGNTGKVEVLYNGISQQFYKQSKDTLASIKSKYVLPDQFIFFLGNTAPKKNLPGMLKAYQHYCKNESSPLPIVIAEISETDLFKVLQGIGASELSHHIVLTGYVPQKDLPALYSAAKLFMYPSLRESFGIPIIEAMACGTPVITSNTSSMPEVASEFATLVDPKDPIGIANKMHEILNRPQSKASEEQRIQHADKFSWLQTARKTTNYYLNKKVEYVTITESLSA